MARRTVFERVRDIRILLCLLALEVRRGTLEVIAFCFLTTHVHLVLRSPKGELSRALRRVFNGYVRWFNRSRRRDGSLFRGRFGSRRIFDSLDLLNVVAYVDDNPVGARLAADPVAYAHGSAACWERGRAPRWLDTQTLARLLGVEGPEAAGAREAYQRVISRRRGLSNRRLVEARFANRDADPEPLDDLVAAAPQRVYAWMLRKAALADRTRPGLPILDAEAVDAAWQAKRTEVEGKVHGRRGPARSRADLARVAVLRDLAGLRYTRIADWTAMSVTAAHAAYKLHADLLARDSAYREGVTRIARAALGTLCGASVGSPRGDANPTDDRAD
jgi:hypothetical protein